MNKRRPYTRPMGGWWRRNPFFVEYMVHEGTALFVAAYSLVLLVGLACLAQGEARWNGWLEGMKSPLAIVFHLITLAMISYHSWTWFRIMPKTMPPIVVRGKRLPAAVITGGGIAAVVLASLVLLGLAWGMTR